MQQTANYGLKKPMGTDVVNIVDLNDNADIIDQQLKENKDAIDTKETPAGAQAKADSAETKAKAYADSITPTKVSQLTNDKGYIAASGAPVQSVNGKTGAVSVTAGNVGAAPAAHVNDTTKHITSAERSAWNAKPGSQRAVSDSVASTSSSIAASSKAVKTAYDKGVSAYNLANTKEPAFSKKTGFNLDKSDNISSLSSNTLATSKAVASVNARIDYLNQIMGRRVIKSWGTDEEFKTFIQNNYLFKPNKGSLGRWAVTNNIEKTSVYMAGGVDQTKIAATPFFNVTGKSLLRIDSYLKIEYDMTLKLYLENTSGVKTLLATYTKNNDFVNRAIKKYNISSLSGQQKFVVEGIAPTNGRDFEIITYEIYGISLDNQGLTSYVDIVNNTTVLQQFSTDVLIKSPIFSPSDKNIWDIITYDIDPKGGHFRVDILNGDTEEVLISNIKNEGSISSLQVDKLRVGIRLSRDSVSKSSPVLKSVSLIYLK